MRQVAFAVSKTWAFGLDFRSDRNSLLRFLLVEAAQVTVRSNPEWRVSISTWRCNGDGSSRR
jgi:hypothetical protein